MRLLIVSALVLLMIPCAAQGQLYLEGYSGLRVFSEDAKELLGGGIVFGGAFGYLLHPVVGIEGRANVGIHGEGTAKTTNNGLSLNLALAGRVRPFAQSNSSVQLFFLGEVGRGSIAWEWIDGQEDALGSWIFGGGAGLSIPIADNFDLGGEVVFDLHSWDATTREGLGANEFSGNDALFSAHVKVFF